MKQFFDNEIFKINVKEFHTAEREQYARTKIHHTDIVLHGDYIAGNNRVVDFEWELGDDMIEMAQAVCLLMGWTPPKDGE